jgi:maltose/moltooligosaccharide transporter
MTSNQPQQSFEKPRLGFWEIWNLSFGFLGIQFGWGLQMGNMSAIYEYLGAKPDELPILWLAAPMTGLIVQPIVGYLSDRTWGRFGRRRPYFLIGAVLASICLVIMPYSSTLWMAAGLLWILDASINISMEPFRAFIADMLPKEQITRGYTMQSFFIGLGAILASLLPWLLINVAGMEGTADGGTIPAFLKISFGLGALAFLLAVLWTVAKVKEYPPQDMEAFKRMKKEQRGVGAAAKDILSSIVAMPKVMKQLALVQFFTWMGLFLMWFYFTVAVANDIYGANGDTQSPLYAEGLAWANICFGFYSLVTFLFSFVLPEIADRMGKKYAHALSLLAGAMGLISVGFIKDPNLLLLSMVGVGIAWTSTLAMPYAILAPKLRQDKIGVYMGIFNFFIVIPEILATLFFGLIMLYVLDNDRILAVMTGGGSLIIAAIFALLVDDSDD